MQWIEFLSVTAVVIATPGPDTAVTLRNTFAGGAGAGLRTAFGIACGQLVWTLAAGLGLAAVLIASGPWFLAVKCAGAAYLVWLGLQALRAGFRPGPGRDAEAQPPGGGTPFRQGFLSNLGNPKMAVFFVSLLPQVAPVAAPEAASGIIPLLGLILASMTFAWLAATALAAARAGRSLDGPRLRRWLARLTGAALVGLGLRLAVQR